MFSLNVSVSLSHVFNLHSDPLLLFTARDPHSDPIIEVIVEYFISKCVASVTDDALREPY
jgi:hypothetical protein